MIGSSAGRPVPVNGTHGFQKIDFDGCEQQGFDGPTLKIKVSHGSNLHNLTVLSNFNFGDLKGVIAQEIGIEPVMQKLFFRGKEKEDCDYLQMAGVKDGSTVVLLEDTGIRETSSKEMKDSNEISRGGEAVAEVRAEVDMLSEKVSALQAVVYGGTKIDDKDIVYLTEMLMRQLLKLDGIEAEGEGKMQRKTEVRRVQSLAETVDAIKARNSNPFNPFGDCSNSVSVSTEWETFDSGVGSLNTPKPIQFSTEVTQEWEHFD